MGEIGDERVGGYGGRYKDRGWVGSDDALQIDVIARFSTAAQHNIPSRERSLETKADSLHRPSSILPRPHHPSELIRAPFELGLMFPKSPGYEKRSIRRYVF